MFICWLKLMIFTVAQGIIVGIIAGLIRSPESSLRAFVPNATSWSRPGRETKFMKWSTLMGLILVRKIGFSGTGCPFPASIACWQAWSILHLLNPGISLCSSTQLKSFAKSDSIWHLVCKDSASSCSLINTLISPLLMLKYFFLGKLPSSFSIKDSVPIELQSLFSCPGQTFFIIYL